MPKQITGSVCVDFVVGIFRAMRRMRLRLSAPSRRLVGLGAGLVAAMATAIILTVSGLRAVALDNANHDVTRLSMAIVEQTSRSLQAVDLVLQVMRGSIADGDVTTEAAFRREMASEETHETLAARVSNLPQADAITVIDAAGKLVNFSRRWPIPETDLSDRNYYKHFRDTHDQGLLVSHPLRNRGDGAWTVYLVRRVSSPSGEFLGLVLGAVKLQYFTDFYKALVGNEVGTDVALRRRDGVLLSRYPDNGAVGTKLPSNSPWYEIDDTDQGPRHADTTSGRIVSVRPLPDYPLVVDVGVSTDVVLANWYHVVMLTALGSLCAMLFFALLLRTLFRQLRRLEKSESSLRYVAQHDHLTKLANRALFQSRLDDSVIRSEQSGRGLALLYLDLDRFKSVNDTRGHGVGDKLLAEVAARMRAAVRETDTVARVGGDEFAIVQTMIDQPVGAEGLAVRLMEAVARPYDIDGSRCVIGVSIGIALYPRHGTTAVDLQRNADTALYRAKADGRGTHYFFEPRMDGPQQDKFLLEQELRTAIGSEQLEMAYQPIVDATSCDVVAVEALMRWRHPDRGLIAPGDFIEIAETSGLIIPMGYWALETACAEVSTWPEPVSVSVNLSPVQVRQEELGARITDILSRTGLAPERLILEVTEGLLLERTEHTQHTMAALRAIGVRFSLDDFGTAHAGLSYIRTFPFDTIKIDKSFVQDACTRRESRAIVEAIVVLSRGLGLDVVAEGVETEEQLSLVRTLGCHYVQGYLTGRPTPAGLARTDAARSQSGRGSIVYDAAVEGGLAAPRSALCGSEVDATAQAPYLARNGRSEASAVQRSDPISISNRPEMKSPLSSVT